MSRHKRPNIQTADSITIDPDCHDLEIIPRELSSEMDPSTGSSDMLFDPSVSDYVLDEKIESYKSYLRNLNTNDGGVKLKLHLERLEKEKARRELQKKTGCQAQVIEETNASAQLSDKRDCLDSEITPSNAWLASPNGRFGPSSGQECSPFSPKSNKSESTTKLCSQADRSANKIRHANDLEGSSSEVKHGVCPSCCQKPPSSKISADTNGEQNQFLCTQCNRDKSILSHASMPTPTNSELCKETLSKTPRRRTSGRSCVGKQGHGGCGGTVDTAMEVSDDEEKETVLACVSPASCSSHHPRRQGLRSAFKRKAGLKVAYPSSDDPEAIEVQYGDLQHLDPFEFLNDTVIDFYIKYIQIEKICSPEKSRHFHFFNSFFYKKLLTGKKKLKGDDGFLKLRKWTKGTNIFEKSYLLMPIHDRAHWSLAIICFPKADENIDVLQAHILHLDSMTSTSGHTSQDIFRVLKSDEERYGDDWEDDDPKEQDACHEQEAWEQEEEEEEEQQNEHEEIVYEEEEQAAVGGGGQREPPSPLVYQTNEADANALFRAQMLIIVDAVVQISKYPRFIEFMKWPLQPEKKSTSQKRGAVEEPENLANPMP